LWRDVCLSTWGISCQSFTPYKSWREMFIERPHLHFHGLYMNKVELFRQGEATLEKFYPPWMKVIYYRYLRFFSDGTMLMHTSAADPITTIPLLKNPKAHVDGMCKGMYRIKDNQISCILKRVKRREGSGQQHRRKTRRAEQQTEPETTFYIDLSLHGYKSQPNVMLKWEKYSISVYYSIENETTNELSLTDKEFPACKFARVKSYTAESDTPLSNRPI